MTQSVDPRISDVGIQYNPAKDPGGRQCVIVLGPARSGTSVIAGILRMLGYSMGERLQKANHEDLEFLEIANPVTTMRNTGHAQRKAKIDRLRALVTRKDDTFALWGWKDPFSVFYLPDLLPSIRNPKIIALFRDATATAISRQRLRQTGLASPGTESRLDPSADARRVLAYHGRMIEFLGTTDCPQFWISYEKATRHRELFVDELSLFLQQPIAEEKGSEIAGFLKPGGGQPFL